jgi:hypothetical protein
VLVVIVMCVDFAVFAGVGITHTNMPQGRVY